MPKNPRFYSSDKGLLRTSAIPQDERRGGPVGIEQADSTATTVEELRADFNALLAKLR